MGVTSAGDRILASRVLFVAQKLDGDESLLGNLLTSDDFVWQG